MIDHARNIWNLYLAPINIKILLVVCMSPRTLPEWQSPPARQPCTPPTHPTRWPRCPWPRSPASGRPAPVKAGHSILMSSKGDQSWYPTPWHCHHCTHHQAEYHDHWQPPRSRTSNLLLTTPLSTIKLLTLSFLLVSQIVTSPPRGNCHLLIVHVHSPTPPWPNHIEHPTTIQSPSKRENTLKSWC